MSDTHDLHGVAKTSGAVRRARFHDDKVRAFGRCNTYLRYTGGIPPEAEMERMAVPQPHDLVVKAMDRSVPVSCATYDRIARTRRRAAPAADVTCTDTHQAMPHRVMTLVDNAAPWGFRKVKGKRGRNRTSPKRYSDGSCKYWHRMCVSRANRVEAVER